MPEIIGRYAIYDPIAAGGMATVHLGRLIGAAGFSRTVAIKRLRPQFAKDREFVSMFVDEARLAARISHPNVVPILDVVTTDSELFLVMDYVQGVALSHLLRAGRDAGIVFEPRITVAVMIGVLHGLHAAHEAKGKQGEPLHLVHRDVSPQNILVGIDGVPRVFDFGIAKARGRLQTTQDGQVKGKLAYMAPEQLAGAAVDRRSDIYAVAVVLWEALSGRRLFDAEYEAELFAQVLDGALYPPSTYAPDVPEVLDDIVMRSLAASPEARHPTGRDMARELERHVERASPADIGQWVQEMAESILTSRADLVAEIESQTDVEGKIPESLRGTPSGRLAAGESAAGDSEHGQPSQASSLSVVRPSSRVGRGAKRWPALAVGAALLAGASALAAWLLGSSDTAPERAPAGDTSHTAAVAGPGATPSRPSLEPTERASADAAGTDGAAQAPPTAPAATATAAASPSAPAKPKSTPLRPPQPRAPSATAPAVATARPPEPSCDPPYWVDAEGIRHLKPECL